MRDFTRRTFRTAAIDPVKAVATRRRFYDMAAAEKDGAGYRLVPSAWNAVL
jgi:hypothetical protein